MKHFALLALCSVWFLSACSKENLVPENTQLVEISDISTYNQKLASGVSIVFYHATWCTKCASQRPAVENLVGKSEFNAVFFGQVDYEKNTNIVNQAGCSGLPNHPHLQRWCRKGQVRRCGS